jgi:excinuclease ABC subunit A
VKLRSPLILSSDRACRGRVSKDDWIIDRGPEGGDKGGEIVAVGTPEEVAREARSYTGHYLEPLLQGKAPPVEAAPTVKARRSSSMRQREAAE